MKKWKWNFSKKNEPEHTLVDSFSDSKFNINCVASFTREIVQNSLDAKNGNSAEPVRMKFEIKKIESNKVPGVSDLIYVLNKSLLRLEHKETINKFKRAIEELQQNEIRVLKVSDYNTVGMSQKSWEALLFNEGISSKQSESSAGRHGVGKKASFLMSLCNTVFYATKNIDNETFFSGKTVLVDWQEDKNKDEWFSRFGWFGEKKENNINFLKNQETNDVDDFFVRKQSYGSDVIILAPIFVDEQYDLNRLIINSILENFYIGLCENKLEVTVNNIEINSKNVDKILDEYYIDKFTKQGIEGSNITYGLLKDFRNAYVDNKNKPIVIKIPRLDSYLDLYITLKTEKAKKYYSFYRDHGMKIKDERYSDADRAFAAIVVARGDEINSFLLRLENAAHDDFVIDTNTDQKVKKNDEVILSYIYDMIKCNIKKITKLDLSDEIELNELNDIIENPGEISRKVAKNSNKNINNKSERKIIIQTESNKKADKEWEKRIKPLDSVQSTSTNVTQPGKSRPIPYSKELDENTAEEKKVLREIAYEKMLVTLHNCYYMQFSCPLNLKNVSIQVTAKNVDDAENDVGYMLNEIIWNNKVYYNNGENYIELGDLNAFEEMKIFIRLKELSRYKLYAKIVGKTYD